MCMYSTQVPMHPLEQGERGVSCVGSEQGMEEGSW